MTHRCRRPLSNDRSHVWPLCFLSVALLFNSGCSLTEPVAPDDGDDSTSAVAEHAPAEEIWRALAQAVDAGTIDTTTRLARCVTVLTRNGDLSLNDVAAFDATFPSAAREERPLSKKDADLLRTLK